MTNRVAMLAVLAIVLVSVLAIRAPHTRAQVVGDAYSTPTASAQFTGVFAVRHIDYPDGRAEDQHFLQVGAVRYALVSQLPLEILPGSVIRLHGSIRDGSIAVDLGAIEILAPPELQALTGEQRTLVILFNFPDDQTPFPDEPREPFTTAEVHGSVFSNPDSADAYYREDSFGQLSLIGEVIGWYTISTPPRVCLPENWDDEADALALADGYDVDDYDRIVYIFSRGTSCGWSAMADGIGMPVPTRSWLNNHHIPRIIAHELGHNFGLDHANLLDCGASAIDVPANCQSVEYLDTYDTMGGTTVDPYFHFNAPHKDAMGWIPAAQSRDVLTSGTYQITVPLETLIVGTQVLRIYKPNTDEQYYLEYRWPIGFDAGLPPAETSGALIHTWDGNPGTITNLIDTTPQTDSDPNHGIFHRDEALADGRSFCDAQNHIWILQTGHDATSVTVFIDLNSPCGTGGSCGGFGQPCCIAGDIYGYRCQSNLVCTGGSVNPGMCVCSPGQSWDPVTGRCS